MSESLVEARSLRKDAVENRTRILVAARETFDAEGLDVGIDEIAIRAGVGVGTIYRRFGSKDELIAAVLEEIIATVRASVRRAHESVTAAEGFFSYLAEMGQLQFDHAGCLSRLWTIADDDVRTELHDLGAELLRRAQEEGAVRTDLVYEDVTLFLWSLRGVIEKTSLVAPTAWKRHFELFAQSLAPGGPQLTSSPMTFPQAEVISKDPRLARGL